MSASIPHVAFPASGALHEATQAYIDETLLREQRPDAALLAEVMNHFTRDSLDAFMLRPMDELGVTGTQRRIVQFAVDTVEKSTAVVMKATLHKLDREQHRRSAGFMDTMRLQLPHGERDDVWFVSFRAPEDFAGRARDSMARARASGPRAEIQETIAVMKALTDLSIENYYQRPLELLGFGPILRKITEVAIAGVRKGTHSTIESLLPKLDEEQLLRGIDYFDALLLDVPRERLRFPA